MDQHIIISACLALAGLGIGWMLAQLRAGHQVASFQTERRLEIMDQHIIISACLALAGLGIGWMLAQLRAGHQVASFQTER
ncbi:hypothetical protein HZD82_26570, partial [Pantoea agglomerans]|uniref:hypothetical protein n=1 Tax=Enterobacter agglomerans TaxID=549 RepID=UPI001A901BDD